MGLELDYSYDDFESMFKFNNPKGTSSCVWYIIRNINNYNRLS